MENREKVTAILRKLFDLALTLLGLLIAAVGAAIAMLKKLDWKGFASDAQSLTKHFSKEKALIFLKTHKKAVLVCVIVIGVLMMAADSLLYEPVDYSYRKPGSSSYDYSKHSVYRDCSDCLGTGDCIPCKASGYYSNYGFKVECPYCDGNKVCGTCLGTGEK